MGSIGAAGPVTGAISPARGTPGRRAPLGSAQADAPRRTPEAARGLPAAPALGQADTYAITPEYFSCAHGQSAMIGLHCPWN